MKIIVCVKQVPDTETRIRIQEDGTQILKDNINWILNPYDEFAVEEALRIKGANSDCEITAITVGPERAINALRSTIAMGIDKVMHIKTDENWLDPSIIAMNLAHQIKNLEYDLILFGKKSMDDENMQVGPMVAELLDLPCVTQIIKFSLEENNVIVRREMDSTNEVITTSLPAVFTAEKGLNEPRFPTLRNIMLAKRKPIDEKVLELSPPKVFIRSLQYPPVRETGNRIEKGIAAVPGLVRWLREEAKTI